jgi:hypothetical protein
LPWVAGAKKSLGGTGSPPITYVTRPANNRHYACNSQLGKCKSIRFLLGYNKKRVKLSAA